MLDVKVTVVNEKIVIQNIDLFGKNLKPAAKRGIGRAAVGIHEEARQWLSGKGGAGKKKRQDYIGFTKRRSGTDDHSAGEVVSFRSYVDSGGYPVPIRTGHLLKALAMLTPGQSKPGNVGTVTAGDDEFIIFNSARYALAVFLGLGSSAKFGERNAIQDAFDYFNHGGRIQQLVGEEVRKEINKG